MSLQLAYAQWSLVLHHPIPLILQMTTNINRHRSTILTGSKVCPHCSSYLTRRQYLCHLNPNLSRKPHPYQVMHQFTISVRSTAGWLSRCKSIHMFRSKLHIITFNSPASLPGSRYQPLATIRSVSAHIIGLLYLDSKWKVKSLPQQNYFRLSLTDMLMNMISKKLDNAELHGEVKRVIKYTTVEKSNRSLLLKCFNFLSSIFKDTRMI